jgi:hypothetical protein
MIFIINGSLHLEDIFGISQIIIDPDAIDSIDIVTIGLMTDIDSTEDEWGLCSRGLQSVITKNRIE